MGDGTGISCFLSLELLSFWPVLTEAKAGFDSPAASRQAWEGIPSSGLTPSHSAWATCQNSFIFPFRHTVSQINNARELLASLQYICVL